MDYWIQQGIDRFVLSVGYRRQAIIDHFGSSYGRSRIDYVIEESPLGTGGGLLLASEKVPKGQPFIVLNGDTFFEVDKSEMLRFHLDRGSDWTVSLFRTKDTKRYMGVEVGSDGAIRHFKIDSGEERLANGGIYLLDSEVLSKANWRPGDKVSLEDEIMPGVLAAGGRFFGYECIGRFIDIGVPEDYYRAGDVISAR